MFIFIAYPLILYVLVDRLLNNESIKLLGNRYLDIGWCVFLRPRLILFNSLCLAWPSIAHYLTNFSNYFQKRNNFASSFCLRMDLQQIYTYMKPVQYCIDMKGLLVNYEELFPGYSPPQFSYSYYQPVSMFCIIIVLQRTFRLKLSVNDSLEIYCVGINLSIQPI